MIKIVNKCSSIIVLCAPFLLSSRVFWFNHFKMKIVVIHNLRDSKLLEK